MDLAPVIDLLDSLARLNHCGFQVWDDLLRLDGAIGAVAAPPEANPRTAEAVRSLLNGAPAFTLDAAPGLRAHGILVAPRSCRPWALVALEPRSAGAPEAGGAALRELLAHLKRLVEDPLSLRQEAESLTQELDRTYEDLYLFSRIATQIKSLQFSDARLRELVRDLLDAMRVDLAVARFPERPHYDVLLTAAALPAGLPEADRFAEQLVAHIARDAPVFEDNCHIVNDSRQAPAFAPLAPVPYRTLGVSIRHGSTSYGWLVLVSFNLKEIFRRGEYRLLSSMAEQIALVIANSDLVRDLESFVISTTRSLVQAIEAKDIYTRGHSERVSRYCALIGDALALDEKSRKDLQWASILHDIGKIGTPEVILNKPGRLTEEEYALIKLHPAKGAEILTPIAQLRDALPAIASHHERFDGRGYPAGIAGARIPLLARVISVADTFDAITSSRAYRPAAPREEALRVLDEVAGTQLDPEMVRVFKQALAAEPSEAGPAAPPR
jgi:HD-GYP domain-containing protein (c-di-GMP phosphodiesterase class II)